MAELKAVLIDFHGVLCTDYFYHTLEKEDPSAYNKISTEFFTTHKKDIYAWMRNEKSSQEINRMISDEYALPYPLVEKHFYDSVKAMKLNQSLLALSQQLREQGIKTAIFSDNMDVLLDVIVPHNNLYDFFDFVFSSAHFGKLKMEDDLVFTKHALHTLGSDFSHTLLIDDGKDFGDLFEKKDGHFFFFQKNNMFELTLWMKNEFSNIPLEI